jgi:uncharacterized protein (DUF1800 family)
MAAFLPALWLPDTATAVTAEPDQASGSPTDEETTQDPTDRRSARSPKPGTHLARRATYGPSPAVLAEVSERGTRAWLEQQLNPSRIPDPVAGTLATLYPKAHWGIADVHQAVRDGRLEEFNWDVMWELGQHTLAMAVWSTRQLNELMVEFWSNHLHVTNPFDGAWDSRQDYDQNVIRKHALGKYSDMLAASAAHPAMLTYLNQADSTKNAPNENYGRELLELHTVGVDAGYSEAMVLDSARIMTGCTINWDRNHPGYRQYTYNPDDHWTGPVRVLGYTARNDDADGRNVAAAYLTYLARHPATARTIARKLAVRFVTDAPSTALVNQLADVYLENDTAIAPVMRALLTSREFMGSAGQKTRRPYDDLIATLRTLQYQLLPASAGPAARRSGVEALYWTAWDLGQAPLAWPGPDGYPDVATAWASAGGLLERWNMHQGLASGWWPANDKITTPRIRGLLPGRLTTYKNLIDHLATKLTGEPLSAKDTAVVLTFLDRSAGTRVKRDDPAVTWDLQRLVALLLSSANHQAR